MFVVGLSGGIGSGKTVASDHFGHLGIDVVDTDVIARHIVEPGQNALAELASEFGDRILHKDGTLNRAALRDIAFSSHENKAKLDAITHPAIRIETLIQIANSKSPYCIVVVPLLHADSPFGEVMDRVLIVVADRETKIQRVMKRSKLDREDVIKIMDSQLDDSQRLQFADDIIENNSSLEFVYGEVEKLHRLYLSFADES